MSIAVAQISGGLFDKTGWILSRTSAEILPAPACSGGLQPAGGLVRSRPSDDCLVEF